jgi:transcriptional regulator with XRE-family HTH domain
MPTRGSFVTVPPYAVESAVKTLGANLRRARVRRNISLVDMASRLGIDRHVLADAENGKITTGIGVYVGLMWCMDLLGDLKPVADPNMDDEGSTLARLREKKNAYPNMEMDNDF